MKTIICSGIALSIFLFSCQESANTNSELAKEIPLSASTTDTLKLIEHGAYLVGIMGCDDCHSPKVMTEFGPAPDMERRFSGHPAEQAIGDYSKSNLKDFALFNHSLTAAVGPWGVSYAANISSDPTGIGNWSFEQFKKAVQEGKSKGMDSGRPLLPPMPWPNYKQLNEDDLKSIFMFLKSSKPIQNVVPAPIPPM